MIGELVFCTLLPKTGDCAMNCKHCMPSEMRGEGREPRRRKGGQGTEDEKGGRARGQGQRKREKRREKREETCGRMDAVATVLLCVVACIRSVADCTHCLLSEVGGRGRDTGGEGRKLNCLTLFFVVGGEGQGPERQERGQESEAGRRGEGGSQGGREREGKRERRERAGGQVDAVAML